MKTKEYAFIGGTKFRVKGWQLLALHQYVNTICRAHWGREEIIETFRNRGVEVELYNQFRHSLGGYNSYIVVNKQHKNYKYIVGGMENV